MGFIFFSEKRRFCLWCEADKKRGKWVAFSGALRCPFTAQGLRQACRLGDLRRLPSLSSLLFELLHPPSLRVVTRGAVVDACAMLTMAVGTIFSGSEVIAIVRINQCCVLFNLSGLRIFHP